MAKPPYHIARQEHIGEALDELQRRGLISWSWHYENRRAIYIVREDVEAGTWLDTRSAEALVERLYQRLGVVWFPVPHPGGETQREQTLRRIARARDG